MYEDKIEQIVIETRAANAEFLATSKITESVRVKYNEIMSTFDMDVQLKSLYAVDMKNKGIKPCEISDDVGVGKVAAAQVIDRITAEDNLVSAVFNYALTTDSEKIDEVETGSLGRQKHAERVDQERTTWTHVPVTFKKNM
jgi:hypothetical protein